MGDTLLRGGMQGFVKTLTGKIITIETDETDTIETVKKKICDKAHYIFTQPDDFYLVSNGRQLSNGNTIGSYNIRSGNHIFVLLRLRGGMDAG
jgi:hypothetical protein